MHVDLEKVGEEVIIKKYQAYEANTSVDIYTLLRLMVTDQAKKGIVPKYYSNAPSPPAKAHIYFENKDPKYVGFHEVPVLPWKTDKWGSLNIEWKEVKPKSNKNQDDIIWTTEEVQNGWSGGHHLLSYTEGTRWFRAYLSSGGSEPIASPEEEKSHRISMKGEDSNSSAALAASYINIPFILGEESYIKGVDCSGLCCLAKDIPRTTATGLHDAYLRSNTDNDCAPENNIQDNSPEPWDEPGVGINGAVDGDMWYVHMRNTEGIRIKHVGIYTLHDNKGIIHASGGERSKVKRDNDPHENLFWNGSKREERDPEWEGEPDRSFRIFRGTGTN